MAIQKPSDLEPGQAGYRVNTPPIPHPSALGDLYEACQIVLALYDNIVHDEYDGTKRVTHLLALADPARSAIRKAGGVA